MRSLIPLRRDPAPSRIRYRLSRLWLRPWVRAGLRLWLPASLLVLALGEILSRPETQQRIEDQVAALRSRLWAQPEFLLTGLSVVGGSEALRHQVIDAVDQEFPVSSLAIDLQAVRRRVEALSAVAAGRVSVIGGNLLIVSIVERQPVAVLRREAGLWLIDREGILVAAIAARATRADLPLLLGEGAERAVPEALQLLRAARRIEGRIRGLVRVGERRWDLLLDRGQRILLPEEGAVAALQRVMALDRAEDLLARDATHIDLRDGARPVLRLGRHALEALGRAGEGEDGENT